MQDNDLMELKKYVKLPKLVTIFLNALWVMGVIVAVVFVVADKNIGAAVMSLIFSAIFAVICALNSDDYSRVDKTVKNVEQQGDLLTLLSDFRNGGKAFKDSLRLGGRYLIGKNTGTIISYGEVTRIYQYVHKTNLIEDSRMLRVETTNGKTYDLCKLPLRGKADDEVAQVISYIVSINGNVQVGYNK